MRAIAYNGSRSDSNVDCLVDVVLPNPELSPGDLLVRVEAVSVNPVDTKVRRREQPAPEQWRVLGWDAAGRVEAIGSAVQGFAVGDPVWYAGALDRPGCNSELHAVDHRLVARRPATLSAAEAAALPLTAITAWELLFDRLRLPRRGASSHPRRSLLVVGAAGGVGSILVQLVRELTDFTLIATASRPESQAWLQQFGVEHCIDHRQPLAAQLAALELSPVSHAISLTHTADHFADLVELLEPQGALALIDDPDPHSIDVLALKRKSLSLHWELMFTRSLYQTPDLAKQGELLQELAGLVEAGRIRSTLTHCLGPITASHLREAHQRLESGSSIGKLVLSGWG
ncbi:MAG: zinc-binding alcohol dehydrogenase family protein [Cyanobacteria bacterium M_surface_10_m2_179]|nr:zinc-binding alcohol dehydrogenase family protein [Cyanobacteria bacterium M_surface_10_m2_179]